MRGEKIMNILIVDDDISFSEMFAKDVSLFLYKYNSNIKIKIYNSDFKNIDFRNNFRIAFVDIDLKGTNGIALSKLIKKQNSNCDIVFVSAKNNLIHSSLSVQPFFFIRKSNYTDDLYVFFELIKELLINKSIIQLSYKLTKITIPVQDIIYIESAQHILNIHTPYDIYKDGRTLKNISSILPANTFIKIHRAFLINCKYIYSTSRNEVVLYKNTELDKNDLIKLRISRSYQKDFENKYQEYLLL